MLRPIDMLRQVPLVVRATQRSTPSTIASVTFLKDPSLAAGEARETAGALGARGNPSA
jgi:hypothetical protein